VRSVSDDVLPRERERFSPDFFAAVSLPHCEIISPQALSPDIARVAYYGLKNLCCKARFDRFDPRHIAQYARGQNALQLHVSLRFSSPRDGNSCNIRADMERPIVKSFFVHS
jgi:hypothetical protein